MLGLVLGIASSAGAQEATPETTPDAVPLPIVASVLPDGTPCAWHGYLLLDNVFLEVEQVQMIATITPQLLDTPPALLMQTITTDDGAGWIFEACWLEVPERWLIVALAGQIGGSRDTLDDQMLYEAFGGPEATYAESAEAVRAWIDANELRFDGDPAN
jgi:hypothetical protein